MFFDRKREKNIPKCPFCGRDISRPVETKTDFGDILCGRCGCNTIYVCDLTGHCVGEAYMEALVLLKGDWDIGTLDPDSDYLYEDMDYDYKTHKKVNSANIGESPGKLVFLKSTKNKTVATLKDEDIISPKKGNQKKTLKKLLKEGELEKIVSLSRDDKHIINQLFAFSYDKSDVTTWKAIESIGLISKEISQDDPDFIRNTTRRLLWSMTEESGGVSWSAPEMLGEIIRSNPEEFGDLIPILWSNRDEGVFREGVIWAMGRIAEKAPEKVRFISDEITKIIDDTNPTVRGYAIWLLGKISDSIIIKSIEKYREDQNRIIFYRDGILADITVGEIVNETINSLL